MRITRQPLPAHAGFTLVEVLVAVFVLTMALIPAFLLASSSVKTASAIRGNFVASQLAQEGVEVVRALRDDNWFATPALPFDAGLDDGTYEIERDSLALQANQERFLNIALQGEYGYGAGEETVFKRAITITHVSDTELRVQSTVSWGDSSGTRSVTIESHLYDWF